MSGREEIERLRRRIDALDERLLDLLNERCGCSVAIGAVKRRLGLRVYDPAREAEIVRLMLDRNRGPLKDEAVRRLFERILDESRSLERSRHDGGAEPDEGGEG